MKLTKLVSLNPDRYEELDVDKLIEQFGAYCRVSGMQGTPTKSFEDWRLGEI